ncbi:hypothetical protein BOX15_Mlig012807g1 [Macrostomum lignano]|uniref:Caspase family p20 domain-containing protein n=1 Tax=Macrostomum lignano TaxID=282301 RepID=A0A267GBW8_9PLAT|nr:hypothetical protein BOX15_Mlig012807g1 [Macrostomum lignano]
MLSAMAEACDAPRRSTAPTNIPNQSEDEVEQNSRPQTTPTPKPVQLPSFSGQCRAVIFNQAYNQEVNCCLEVRDYERFLDRCGFIVNYVPSTDFSDIKNGIEGVAKDAKQLVVVVLLESDEPADLDEIVKLLLAANDSTQKLLIFCRISNTDAEEKADCVKLMRPDECRGKLRNMVLMSITVKMRDEVRTFLQLLADLKKRKWHSRGLGELIQYEIESEVFDKFRLKTQNGLTGEFIQPRLPVKMLKDREEFARIIGDGSHLKQLDAETVERLKTDPNPIDDLVYYIGNRATKKALIIHNVSFVLPTLNRPESYMDFKNLRHVLTLMQFSVTEMVNLTAEQMREAVRNFANDESHGDACVLAIMSHGSLGIICGTDYRRGEKLGIVEEFEILQLMSRGAGVWAKPRLVLIQACRIDSSEAEKLAANSERVCAMMTEMAIQVGIHQGNPASGSEPPPEQSGLIVAHSTSPGDFAFRSSYGSRFILALCATFYEFAHKEDLVSMLTRINFAMVRGFKQPELNGEVLSLQLPCWTVQTHKKFFLVSTQSLFEGPAEAMADRVDQQQPKSSRIPLSGEVSENQL